MSTTVCLAANTLDYPEGGGHFWVHLNWALGLRSLDCNVVWLELVQPSTDSEALRNWVAALKLRLAHYRLQDALALVPLDGQVLPTDISGACLGPDEATRSDLLLDLRYDFPPKLIRCFRRTAMLDIDPGELQVWLSKGEVNLAPHTMYFSIGETVGCPGALFPDGGIKWHYTPPCVALDWWPPRRTSPISAFTTVAHWYGGDEDMDDLQGGYYADNKRTAFLPYLELPSRSGAQFELALDMGPDDPDQVMFWREGWRIRESAAVASTPWEYQRYIQDSQGEFSCAKPHCIRLQNAWISDRSLCYLASGKPAIVQHTGPSRFLPDAAGLFRFRDIEEAVRHVATALKYYDGHCRLARSLAEEYFDAKKVVRGLLERALA
jgi:hypothetical protein